MEPETTTGETSTFAYDEFTHPILYETRQKCTVRISGNKAGLAPKSIVNFSAC